jgi:C1A family cysteine protease
MAKAVSRTRRTQRSLTPKRQVKAVERLRISSRSSNLHRICNLVPSHNTETDWRFEDAVTSRSIAAPLELPSSVDLREPWWSIGNQGKTGSCVGWGATDGIARYHFVKAGKLAQHGKLSARFTWMASKETDGFTKRPETFIEKSGTSLKAALDVLRKYGAAPESLLPFHISSFMYEGSEKHFFATTAKRRIASYFNLHRNLAHWRTWLATHGPILVGLKVDETFAHAAATHGKLDTFQPKTVRGGHALCVVGYTADNRFIIRNSWGTSWGDRGFGYPSEAYINAAFLKESYGVTV